MLLTALEINHDMCNFDYRNESQFDTNIVELGPSLPCLCFDFTECFRFSSLLEGKHDRNPYSNL